MVRDIRLAGTGLGELVGLLSESADLSDPETIRNCAQRLQLSLRRVPRGNVAEDQWQSVVVAADDRGQLKDLLADVLRVLGEGSGTAASISAWMATGSRPTSLVTAVRECADRLKELRDQPDPRESETQLVVLSDVLAELVDSFGRQDVIVSLFGARADATTAAVAATNEARRAASAVDRMLVGVRIAKAALGRVGSTATPDQTFAAELSIVGQLLDVRMTVDEAVSSLIRIIEATAVLPSAPTATVLADPE